MTKTFLALAIILSSAFSLMAQKISIMIFAIWLFDRWGNLTWDYHYEDKNMDGDYSRQDGISSVCKWNGAVKNQVMDMNGNSKQLAQEDVYVWKVRLRDIFDKKNNYIRARKYR